MKNNKSEKNKFYVSIVKNFYCISIKNAGQKTQGAEGHKLENTPNPSKYTDHAPQVF